ncbi:MAG: hypothetical protein ACMXX9_04155 [Candidatus Woesearchaeota archaeon]
MSLENTVGELFDIENDVVARSMAKNTSLIVLTNEIVNSDQHNEFAKAWQNIESFSENSVVTHFSYDLMLKDLLGMDKYGFIEHTKNLDSFDKIKSYFDILADDKKPNILGQKENYLITVKGVDFLNKENFEQEVARYQREKMLADLFSEYINTKTDSTAQVIERKNRVVGNTIEFPESDNEFTIDYLHDKLNKLRHDVGDKLNEEFMTGLSKKYQEFNLQSTVPNGFTFITDKRNIDGKFNIIDYTEIPSTEELNKNGALFIDNMYSFVWVKPNTKLGHGINILDKVKDKFNGPIFYQTAHNLEDLTEDEINEIESRGALILPKNVAPKLNKSKIAALKEVALSSFLSKDEIVGQYYTKAELPRGQNQPVRTIIEDKEYFITFTKAVNQLHKTNNVIRDVITKNQDLDEELVHKMYVLSDFHSKTRRALWFREIDSNLFYEKSTEDYIEYENLEKNIRGYLSENFKELYDSIVDKHSGFDLTVLSHNDTKWDNWFEDKILGDFGHAAAGTEYKDISRALITKNSLENKALDLDQVDKAIESYIELRKSTDYGFFENIHGDFKKRVYESLFIESLRLASYESDKSKELTDGLLGIANQMYDVLYDSMVEEVEPVYASEVEMSGSFS